MKKYVLHYYNLLDEGGICFESNDPIEVEKEALRRCSNDNGCFTYRMETWNDEGIVVERRFFQNGREFTYDIIQSIRQVRV